MTPTEISQAYAELHDKWPELKPSGLFPKHDIKHWPTDGSNPWWTVADDDAPIPEAVDIAERFAHAACFLACLKACAERGVPVTLVAYDTQAKQMGYFVLLPIANPHTITEVMDKVMQLPKVNT